MEVPVKVTYPDGSTEDVPVKVTVDSNQAGEHEPGYEDATTKPGKPVDVPQTGDTDLPDGTHFDGPSEVPEGWDVDVNPDDGTTTVTPPADAKPGTEVEVPVKVTYPDGTTEDVPVKVTVDSNQAGEHEPGYEDATTKPGKPVDVPQTGDTDLPDGTHFDGPSEVPEGWDVDVNPDDGTTTVTPPADVNPGTEIEVPVKVTYPDGTTEDVPVKVTVSPNDAQSHTPNYDGASTKPGNPVDVPQTGDVPDGTEFEVPEDGIPEGWDVNVNPDDGTTTVTPPADAEPGTEAEIPVKVTYPDGSTEEVPVKVTVEEDDEGDADADADSDADADADADADSDADADADADADTDANSDSDSDEETLPDTGNNNSPQNATLLGSLFAGLGSLFLLGRRRKNNNEEK
ncbi:hypothetical protein JCM2421_04160 [Staphylococcus auricularis]|uniref:Gram-positive cocci surface proteins LPxTG domain-containing protein n=1 Tax=Staphylococcus auricularis TaxID=29379 RepID=A0AAP8PN06_9STAP|nr:hypothetical protein CD158_08560 [Staphylococcus auricularis]QPT05865.1 YPDG domain-containing protein [Staphylococcus auricularis]BCU51644.1 hypothetical protein JCM2421_04160 [Staphylococcus auricularis]SQJ07215.1 Ser-Asp rich fibrinogen/bone sialoprotein-binding protein SdrE_1 [Staphylococcus auricularis]